VASFLDWSLPAIAFSGLKHVPFEAAASGNQEVETSS